MRCGNVSNRNNAVEDAFIRGWENFVARTAGPLKFRFLIQPTVALLLGIRAGLRDYRAGRPAFFWSLLTEGSRRHFIDLFHDVGRVFLLALSMDVVYQIYALRRVYPLELVFTGLILAVVPYLLVRGPTNRIGRALSKQRRVRGDEASAGV